MKVKGKHMEEIEEGRVKGNKLKILIKLLK